MGRTIALPSSVKVEPVSIDQESNVPTCGSLGVCDGSIVTSLECTEASSTGSGGRAFSKEDVEGWGFDKKELVWNMDSLKLVVLANGKKPF